MTRKGQQTVERQLRAHGVTAIEWDHGQKHEIVSGVLVDGRNVEIRISRGCRDDVLLQRLVERKIKEAGKVK